MNLSEISNLLKTLPEIESFNYLDSGTSAVVFVAKHKNYGSVIVKVIYSDQYPDVENYIKATGQTIKGIAKVFDVIDNGEYSIVFQEIVNSVDKLNSKIKTWLTLITDYCLSEFQIQKCFSDNVYNSMSEQEKQLAQELLDDAISGMNWLQTNYHEIDSHSGNYGIVNRNGRPNFVWLDFGHLITENKIMNEKNIADKLGHTLLTKHLRKGALPGLNLVYVDKNEPNKSRQKKIMDKVSKNLNKEPYSHDPPTSPIGENKQELKNLIEAIIDEEVEELDEFNAIGGGGIVGYTLPLGLTPEKANKHMLDKRKK